MRLIIAEKPSVAKAIALVLGSPRRGEGFIETAQGTVTNCFGHLLENAKPEDYNNGAFLTLDQLPFVPPLWRLKPRDGGAGKQLNVIRNLLKQATEVVNAGDPDREGQLLVDEVLEHFGWRGPTKRLWLASLDEESIRRALAGIKDNAALHPLKLSAECRQRADWMVGMNGSIAISRRLHASGGQGSLSMGRVQTPTLALLVRRADEIAHFRPRDFYRVAGHLQDGIRALWQMPKELDGLDDDGRLLDRTIAAATAGRIGGKPAVVKRFHAQQGQRHAPLPFSLSALQKEASRRFGLSAAKTLEAAQELYEAAATTYPRTDCPYLPEEQFAAAGKVLAGIGAMGVEGLDVSRKHPCWNTAKVEAHHGIIPTGQSLKADVSDQARKVYGLIRDSYIRIFLSPERFEAREALFLIDGLEFLARARMVLDPGWTQMEQQGNQGEEGKEDGEDEEVSASLPLLTQGQSLICERGEVIAKRTTPPKPYTDGTLITAMTRVHALVDDPKLKARLRETSGLGTEATRASMIETLIAREYAERRKKEIHPTERGIALIQVLRRAAPQAIDPGTTAIWEDGLADVACGKMSAERFMAGQVSELQKLVEQLKVADCSLLGPAGSGFYCPDCAGGLVARTSRRGTKYFACSNPDCGAAFADDSGKVGKKFEKQEVQGDGPHCPKCKVATARMTTSTGKPYYRCKKCDAGWWPAREDENALGNIWADKPKPASGGKAAASSLHQRRG